jgi:hypothetical protein
MDIPLDILQDLSNLVICPVSILQYPAPDPRSFLTEDGSLFDIRRTVDPAVVDLDAIVKVEVELGP